MSARPISAGAPQAHRRQPRIELREPAHHLVGDDPEADCRQDAGDDEAAIERVHDLAAFARTHEIAADDRRQDREPAQHERIRDGGFGSNGQQERAQQHRRDDRHRVGLEQVGGHAGAIADVVAHVVGDHRRIARIVFGNARFDLAHEIGADVGALGEDAAAQPREDRDQRAAESEADQRLDRMVQALLHQVGRAAGRTDEERVEPGDAEESQAHDQHAGDRAAAKRDGERGVQAGARGFRRAHVRAHRHVHPDVARKPGEDRADREAGRRRPADGRRADDHEQDHADDADRRVLAIEIGLRAGLDRGGDFAHPIVAGRLFHDPADRHDSVDDGCDRADQRENEPFGHGRSPLPVEWQKASEVAAWVCRRPIRRGVCGFPACPRTSRVSTASGCPAPIEKHVIVPVCGRRSRAGPVPRTARRRPRTTARRRPVARSLPA